MDERVRIDLASRLRRARREVFHCRSVTVHTPFQSASLCVTHHLAKRSTKWTGRASERREASTSAIVASTHFVTPANADELRTSKFIERRHAKIGERYRDSEPF